MKFRNFLLIAVIIILNFSMLFILLSKTGRLEKRITMSSNAESSFNETVKATLVKVKDEINILRDVVDLPAASFPSFEEKTEKRDNSPDFLRGYETYYIAFEKLYSQHKKNQEIEKLNKFSAEIDPLLKKYKFSKEQKDSLVYLLSENNIFYSFEYNSDKEKIVVSPFPFENKSEIKTAADFQAFIDATYPKIKSLQNKAMSEIQSFKNYINSETARKIFLEKGLRVTPVTENKDLSDFFKTIKLFTINKRNSQFIGTISYSYKTEGFFINETFYGDYEKIKEIISNIDVYLDLRTTEEKTAELSIKEIKLIGEDPSFKMFLESRGYKLSLTPREDGESLYFDLIPETGGKYIGSFAVNKHTGEIYITDFEEIQISSIKTLKIINSDNTEQKKK